jgi:hypothetical protein
LKSVEASLLSYLLDREVVSEPVEKLHWKNLSIFPSGMDGILPIPRFLKGFATFLVGDGVVEL